MNINQPFVKWVGGKRRLMNQLTPYLPAGDRLIEPFAGSGAVFLNTNYDKYLLNDMNFDLIQLYKVARDFPDLLIEAAAEFFTPATNTPEFYYQIRDNFNNNKYSRLPFKRPAAFLYLNKHCYNGVCRYNKAGAFNVPFGNYKAVKLPTTAIVKFSQRACNLDISLHHMDFDSVILFASVGDVVYCDPPYAKLNNESFTGYTKNGFTPADQERLLTAAKSAAKRGAHVVISNSDTPFTRGLYHGLEINSINAPRTVAANGNRQRAKELIVVIKPYQGGDR